MKHDSRFPALVLSAFLLVMGLLPCGAQLVNLDSLARVNDRHDPLPKFSATLQAGFNVSSNASVAWELGAAWYPMTYAGVGLSLELDDNKGDDGLLSSVENGREEYNPDRIVRFNLHPSLAFRTPRWWMGRRRNVGVMLQCNPGLVLSFPRNDSKWVDTWPFGEDVKELDGRKIYTRRHLKNRDGEWLAWRVRTALSFCTDDGAISIGYSVSNYDINSCRNNLYYKGKRVGGVDHLSMTHSLFISLSLFF